MVRRLGAGTVFLASRARGSLADGRGIRNLLVGTGLVGLMGATAYAAASVSGWLAPTYLLLVVVILTAPRGPRSNPKVSAASTSVHDPGSLQPGRDLEAVQAEWARIIGELSRNLRGWLGRASSIVGRPAMAGSSIAGNAEGASMSPGGPDEPQPDAETPSLSQAEPIEDTASATLRSDPAASVPPKTRKSRSRSRKAAKTAVEPSVEPAEVTWVRVGPGQFVRSDTLPQEHSPVSAPAPAEETPSSEAPASSEETPAIEAPAPFVEILPVSVSTEAVEPPSVEAPAPVEVAAVELPSDPETDSIEPIAALPTNPEEDILPEVVPEADAQVPEDPTTIAPPETVACLDVPDVPALASEATTETSTLEDLPTDSSASEENVADNPPAEEYGIAPSALVEAEASPEILANVVPDPMSEARVSRPGLDRQPEFPVAGQTTGDVCFSVARRRINDRPARLAARRVGRPAAPRREAGEAPGRWRRGSEARRGSDRTALVRQPWRARSPPI